MAKAKTLAMLAGLAGLAYANRDKLFGKKKTYNEDAGDQKTSSYTGDTKKVAASDDRMSDRMSNEDYIKSRMKKAPEDERGSVQSNMLSAITAPKAAPNDQAGNQGVLLSKSLTPAVKPQDKSNIVSKKQKDDYKDKFGQDKTLTDYMNSQRASKNAPIKPISLPDSYKRGGAVKMASGGMTASRRGDGIASRGKTRGKMC